VLWEKPSLGQEKVRGEKGFMSERQKKQGSALEKEGTRGERMKNRRGGGLLLTRPAKSRFKKREEKKGETCSGKGAPTRRRGKEDPILPGAAFASRGPGPVGKERRGGRWDPKGGIARMLMQKEKELSLKTKPPKERAKGKNLKSKRLLKPPF